MTVKNKDTIQENVENILKKFPESRNSYNLMVLLYLNEYHYIEDIAFNQFTTEYNCRTWAKKLPSFLTLCRVMTKLKDKYPPTAEVQKIRDEQEQNYKEEFR